MTTDHEPPPRYARVLMVWVVVLVALYAFQEYFS